MDVRQKSALRSQQSKIADDLILDEDFYAALRRDKIFTNSMLDQMRAEGTPRDKVYKMLELLERRGPKAFDTFVKILRENYDWLADILQEEYNKKLQTKTGRSHNRSTNHSWQQNNTSNQETVYHRTTSIPNLQSGIREMTPPNTGSASILDTQIFSSDSGGKAVMNESREKSQASKFDGTDNLATEILPPNEKNSKNSVKKYRDSCCSPIAIVESSRKVMAIHSSIQNANETDSAEMKTKTSKTQNETPNDAPRQKSEAQCESDNDKKADEFENAENETNDENVDIMPGEEYYELVRRGSSSHNGDNSHFQTQRTPGCEGHGYEENDGDHTTQLEVTDNDTESANHEELAQMMDSIKALYKKLSSVNCGQKQSSDNSEETHESEDDNIPVTWKMMEDEVDKLINLLTNSDDMKMIQTCQQMFPKEERRYPLNKCIENLQAKKRNYKDKLNQMVQDLWGHQQDMTNVRKLKEANIKMIAENEELKASVQNLEQEFEAKAELIEQQENKIQQLETKIQELQDEKKNKPRATPRRGHGAHHRTSNAQGQSPRRMNTIDRSLVGQREVPCQGSSGTAQSSPRRVTFRRTSKK